MNVFLFCVMFFLIKGSFPAITAVVGRSDDEIHYHIIVLGLLAIKLALKTFLKDFNKKYVRIFSDNNCCGIYK